MVKVGFSQLVSLAYGTFSATPGWMILPAPLARGISFLLEFQKLDLYLHNIITFIHGFTGTVSSWFSSDEPWAG
jgi:hypothetical protein